MKNFLTIDELMTAFVSALGYGLSFEIPKILGWEMWQCVILCLLIGGALDILSGKIVFNETVQKNSATKKLIFFVFVLIFLVTQYVALELTGLSMYDYLLEQYMYIIFPAIFGLAFSAIVRWHRARKIRKRYGDGSKGFLYEDMLNEDEVERYNQTNKIITGDYDKNLAVKTKTGIFVGFKEKNVTYYLGIPYAQPPIGKLRWKAPEPLPESDAVFEAMNFGASAIQVEHEGSILKHHKQSEDCLTLNIGVNGKKTQNKKPVIVLFHHGDFSYGGAADPLMYAEGLTTDYFSSVVVNFNYRLGIFGFIDFTEVQGGENFPDAINLGLLDQIAALKWIKENISAFGGDPDNVTVMGFESGAISISLLAACEQAKGLFKKAFIFSGNPDSAYSKTEVSKSLAKKLLQETSTTTMEELQQLSTERLKDAAQKLWQNTAAPTCDGKLIPSDVFAAYRDGKANGIEFIIGIPSNERKVFKSFIGEKNFDDVIEKFFEEILSDLDDETARDVENYFANQTKLPELEAKAKFCENWSALCTYFGAMLLAAAGNKVHLMYWNVKPLIENLGSGTVNVMSAFFADKQTSQMYGNVVDPVMAEILQKFLKKFVDGQALQLYNNEIKGVKAIDWKNFPKALIVSEKNFRCAEIENDLTEIKSLIDFAKRLCKTPARK